MSFQKYPWIFFFLFQLNLFKKIHLVLGVCVSLLIVGGNHNWWVQLACEREEAHTQNMVYFLNLFYPYSLFNYDRRPHPLSFSLFGFGDLVIGRDAWVASSMGLEWWCWFEIIMIWFCNGGCAVLGLG